MLIHISSFRQCNEMHFRPEYLFVITKLNFTSANDLASLFKKATVTEGMRSDSYLKGNKRCMKTRPYLFKGNLLGNKETGE